MLALVMMLERAAFAETVQEEMASYSLWIHRCRLRAWRREPELAGVVAVRFEIERDGQVSIAELASSDLGDARAERCLVRKVQRMWFSPPKGSAELVVTYRFSFAPQ